MEVDSVQIDKENTDIDKETTKVDIDEMVASYKKIQEDKETQSILQKMFNGDSVNIIAFICIIGVFGYIYGVTFFADDIDESHLRFVDQSLGNLYGILNTIIGFYCGNVYSKSRNNEYKQITKN